MRPTVLVATAFRWFPTARLAMGLAQAGFTVKALCPSGHPIAHTAAASEIYTYRGLAPLSSFETALRAAKADIVVPGDDLATQHLHEVYGRSRRQGKAGEALCTLIERSLGSAESFPIVYARGKFIGLAEKEGVRAPRTAVIPDLEALGKWVGEHGLPAILKSDGSSGGVGVKIAPTAEEAERAFRTLAKPPHWMRAAKRALLDRDTTMVWPSVLRRRSTVNAQAWVCGREATSTVACWQGSVLAALHFDVVRTAESRGHATVLRLTDDAEMAAAAETMVRRLNLSGICGFDFMRDVHTGSSFLIEINPRTTQVGHLALGAGRDLPAALYAAVSGEAIKVRPAVTANDTVAIFPHEWVRDAASPFLRSAYHDVPWEAPDLVLACARHYRLRKNWYSPRAPSRDARKALEAEGNPAPEAAAPVEEYKV